MTRFILRILPAVPVWLLYFALMTPLVLVGFPLVAVMATFRGYVPAVFNPLDPAKWSLGLMWLFGNDEDGIDGSFHGFWPKPAEYSWAETWQIIRWSAWRNSVGNARRTRLFGMTVDPKKVTVSLPPGTWSAGAFTGYVPCDVFWIQYRKLGPYVARQGWRFELRFPWNHPAPADWAKQRFFWIGWRIAQQDTVTADVGFAFQPWGKP